MTKKEAIQLFGKRQKNLGDALGLTKGAVSQWPDVLDEWRINLVLGAALRSGIQIPNELIKPIQPADRSETC